MKLRFGNWGSYQLFLVQKQNNFILFKSHCNPSYYLTFKDGALRLARINKEDRSFFWCLQESIKNEKIEKTCYFENAYSNLVMDVPEASQDKCKIVQYPFNNRFNQRFELKPVQNYFMIKSKVSNLYLTAPKDCAENK